MRSLTFAIILTLVAFSPSSGTNHSSTVPEATANASTRRRPVRSSPPAQSLRMHSIALSSTDITADDSDLTPLRNWLTGVRVVGLGDGTHGTHEYYTLKKRLIDFLAREEGINLVTFEAPWAEFNKINHYLQSGEGNPTELLKVDGYFFWNYQEMLDLVVWARAYNERRGSKPPLRFLGVDTLPFGSRIDVLSYFQQVDPWYHSVATSKYQCGTGIDCLKFAREVRQRLIDNRERYEAASSTTQFRDVLQSARVVEQYVESSGLPRDKADESRDRFIAENVAEVLGMYEPASRAFFWGHNEHVGKNFYELSEDPSRNATTRSAGSFLREQFGNAYYVIGSCFLNGSFTAYERSAGQLKLTTQVMEPPAADNYELLFRDVGYPRMLINFRSPTPPVILPAVGRLRHGQADFGKNAKGFNVPLRLLEKFDGMMYLEFTTPAVPLP